MTAEIIPLFTPSAEITKLFRSNVTTKAPTHPDDRGEILRGFDMDATPPRLTTQYRPAGTTRTIKDLTRAEGLELNLLAWAATKDGYAREWLMRKADQAARQIDPPILHTLPSQSVFELDTEVDPHDLPFRLLPWLTIMLCLLSLAIALT